MKIIPAHIAIFLVLNTISFSRCLAQSTQKANIASFLEISNIEDAMLSPTGEWIFYSLLTPLWESNEWEKEVFAFSVKDMKVSKIPNLEKGRDFQFSPNGKYIAFLVDEGMGTQLWVKNFPKGKSFLLTYSASTIKTFEWGPKSLNVYFVNEKTNRLNPNPYGFYADEGANGRYYSNWDKLWEINLIDKRLRPLTTRDWDIEEFDISPNRDYIAITATTNKNIDQPHLKEIFLLDLATFNIEQITFNEVPESAPLWSKDGKYLAFRASGKSTFLLTNKGFHIYNLAQDSIYSLNSQYMGKVDHIAWSSNNQYLLYNESQGFFTKPYKIHIHQDTVISLFPQIKRGTLIGLGYDSARTKMLYSYEEFQKPKELFFIDLESQHEIQITHLNQYSPFTSTSDAIYPFQYKSVDNTIVEGVYLPPFDTIKAPPLIVMLHGGPAENWRDKFYPDWQYFRANGYAIFAPNIRGSSGYGDIFLNKLRGDIGGGEHEDVMAGINTLITEGKACQSHLFLMGWSWGGVLGAWSITKTNRFNAAVLGAPIVDWLAERGSGFTYDLQHWYIGQSSLEAPSLWKKSSSIYHSHKIKTPTLIVHGALDLTHSLHQSRILFHTLKEQNVPTRLLIFPDQGHQLNRPQEIYSFNEATLEWFQQYK